MDEIDGRRERGKKERERWGDLFFFFASYSIEAAQLGLQRHTSEKGKHAEALKFREGGGGHRNAETVDQSRDLHTSQISI